MIWDPLTLAENPIFVRELRRGGALHLCLLIVMGLGLTALVAVVALTLSNLIRGRPSETADDIWGLSYLGSLVVGLFAPPAVILPCLAEERDRGTAEAILLTGYDAERIVVGKISARLYPMAVFAAAVALTNAVTWFSNLVLGQIHAEPMVLFQLFATSLLPVWCPAVSVAISLGIGASQRHLGCGLAFSYGCLGVLIASCLGTLWSLVFKILPTGAQEAACGAWAFFTAGPVLTYYVLRGTFRWAAWDLERSWQSSPQ